MHTPIAKNVIGIIQTSGKTGHYHKIGREAQRHADETGHKVCSEIGFIKDFMPKS